MRAFAPVILIMFAGSASAAADPVVVFLERNGAVVEGDDEDVTIPKFGGGDRAWTGIVKCVEAHFAPFDIDVVERKPVRGEFITAVVGGRASQFGLDDETTNGVGPYDGSVLRSARVHVFSKTSGERDVANLCAVTAHEVAHSLGLDHSTTCGDIMSYELDRCGTRRFMDVAGPCGENGARRCGSGERTQNSYRRLGALVGFRGPQREPAPEPVDDDDEPGTSDDDATALDDRSDGSPFGASDDQAPAIDDPWDGSPFGASGDQAPALDDPWDGSPFGASDDQAPALDDPWDGSPFGASGDQAPALDDPWDGSPFGASDDQAPATDDPWDGSPFGAIDDQAPALDDPWDGSPFGASGDQAPALDDPWDGSPFGASDDQAPAIDDPWDGSPFGAIDDNVPSDPYSGDDNEPAAVDPWGGSPFAPAAPAADDAPVTQSCGDHAQSDRAHRKRPGPGRGSWRRR